MPVAHQRQGKITWLLSIFLTVCLMWSEDPPELRHAMETARQVELLQHEQVAPNELPWAVGARSASTTGAGTGTQTGARPPGGGNDGQKGGGSNEANSDAATSNVVRNGDDQHILEAVRHGLESLIQPSSDNSIKVNDEKLQSLVAHHMQSKQDPAYKSSELKSELSNMVESGRQRATSLAPPSSGIKSPLSEQKQIVNKAGGGHPANVDPFYHAYSPDKAAPGSLWRYDVNDANLPPWLRYYLTWHQHHVPSLWDRKGWRKETKATHPNLFVVSCTIEQCGGTSDRLRPLPFMLRMAYRTKRLLLYYWQSPAPLESFVMPPVGGMDWRMPLHGWVEQKVRRYQPIRRGTLVVEKILENTQRVFHITVQTLDDGSKFYTPDVNGTDDMTFQDVYPHMWRMVFTPVVPIADHIRSAMKDMGITPRGYISAHVRARYSRDFPKHLIRRLAENTMRCASELDPNLPTYVASDSNLVLGMSKKYVRDRREDLERYADQIKGAAATNATYTGLPRLAWHTSDPDPPLQIDERDYVGKPSEYYDTFVDLYLLSLAKCLTHGAGGYGRWASLVGGMGSCVLDQEVARGTSPARKCNWRQPNVKYRGAEASPDHDTLADILLEPMPHRSVMRS